MSLFTFLLDFLPPQILDTVRSTKSYTNKLYNPELRKGRDQSAFPPEQWNLPLAPDDTSDFVSALPRPEVPTAGSRIPVLPLNIQAPDIVFFYFYNFYFYKFSISACSELYPLTRAAWQNMMLDKKERKSNDVLTHNWIKSKIFLLDKSRDFNGASSVFPNALLWKGEQKYTKSLKSYEK